MDTPVRSSFSSKMGLSGGLGVDVGVEVGVGVGVAVGVSVGVGLGVRVGVGVGDGSVACSTQPEKMRDKAVITRAIIARLLCVFFIFVRLSANLKKDMLFIFKNLSSFWARRRN